MTLCVRLRTFATGQYDKILLLHKSIVVEYNVPFLSFVVVLYVPNASRLRRTLIKPSLYNLFQRQLRKPLLSWDR
jgi:hypothetical protein